MINFLLSLLLLVLLLLLAFYFLKTKNNSVIKPKFPPTPPKFPIIGNLHQLGKLPHQNLFKLSQQYGPLMLLHLGSTPTLVISSPNFAEQVLKTHDTTFCTRPRSPGPKRIFYNYSDVVFTPYGDHWRNARKIFVSHLLSTKNDRSFFRAREVEVGNLIDYLSRVGANPVNLDEKIFGLVGGVIGQVAFGKSYKGKQFEGHELKDIMDETMNMVDSFSAGDFFPSFGWIVDYLSGHKGRLDKCFYKLDGYFRMVLEEHRHRETREDDDEDLVDVLIRLSNDEENGVHLSNEQIKAMLMNLFLGGVDTTAITIVWAMCELMRNPRVMHKIQEEIRVKLAVKPKVEGDDLGKFTYLKMIVNETLRLHAPAPLLVPRESMSMCQIRDEDGKVYDIYPKTRVLINAWAIGRDPNSWKNPNEFYPERFDGGDVDFRRHFQFLPFGGGRRICPGISNSIATIEFTLANLLYWFNWEVPNGMNMEDVVSLEEEGGVTIHKRTHLPLVPIKYKWH